MRRRSPHRKSQKKARAAAAVTTKATKATNHHGKKNNKEPDENALYRRAVDLAQPPMTQEKFRELQAIKEELSSSSSSSSFPRYPSSSYVPYPAVTDPALNRVIPRKKEFALGAYPPVDRSLGVQGLWDEKCKHSEFILTPNQHVLRNFVSPVTPYNGLLLFHGVGTGKTCAAVTIAEQFVDKKVLVLVQPGLQTNFRDHIFDFKKLVLTDSGVVDVMKAAEQCTGTRYLASAPESELSDRQALAKRIDRTIRARYTFKGTQVFAKEVERIKEEAPDSWEERLRLRYSDHVIVVDEAHHLRVNLRDEERKAVTPAIRDVLRFTEGVKLLLLTATPMFNDTSDVLELLNLLLINDKRKPVSQRDVFDRRGDLTQSGERLLSDASRGYVSYLRGDDPFSFPLRLAPSTTNDPQALKPDSPDQPSLTLTGAPISDSERFRHTVLTVSDMSAYQRAIYANMDRAMRQAAERTGSNNKYGSSSSSGTEAEDEVAIDDVTGEDVEPSSSSSAASNVATTFLYGMGISNVAYPKSNSRAPSSPSTSSSRSASKNKRIRVVDDVEDQDPLMAMKRAHGSTGFANAFVSVQGKGSSKGLRVMYADPGRQFLAQPSLGLYAPKIKTVLDRVLRSEGVVFVYSRFLDSGIVPMAIALEHAGLTRYGQSDILGDGAVRARNTRGWTYVALTARKHDLTMNRDEEVQAARSADNADGSRVKVILGSDNASEGLDFKNVREVHVLDPWYHFNKTEQIVGRAARNCSHRDLPVEKRNVTIYLHASRIRGSPRETIDIRAYRIAEQKQRRILRVEAALVANSVDCNLNKHTLFYDPRALNLRVDVVTSQGRVLHNYPIGDRYPRQRIACDPDLRLEAPYDDSTYDPLRHAGGVHSCKAVIIKMFARRHYYKLDDIRLECRATYPSITDDAIFTALQELLDDHTPIKNPWGRDGYIVYASDTYMFQSRTALDERDGLHDASRTYGTSVRKSDDKAGEAGGQAVKAVKAVAFRALGESSSSASSSSRGKKEKDSKSANSAPSSVTSRRYPQAPPSSSSYDAVDGSTWITLSALVVDMMFDAVGDMLTAYGLPERKYGAPALDFHMDRLDRRTMMNVVKYALLLTEGKEEKDRKTTPEISKKRVQASKILDSLKRGYVLWSSSSCYYMYDYFRNGYICFHRSEQQQRSNSNSNGSRSSSAAKQRQQQQQQQETYACEGPALHRASETDPGAATARRTNYRTLKGYVLHPTQGGSSGEKPRPIALFKLLGVSAESSGCVCHQTSSVRVHDIRRLIREVDAAALSDPSSSTTFDKRQLCVLYELVMRANEPTRFARPAVAVRVFTQRGKRMPPSSSGSSGNSGSSGSGGSSSSSSST